MSRKFLMSGEYRSNKIQNSIFLAGVSGFIGGVALHSFFSFPLFFIISILALELLTLFILFFFFRKTFIIFIFLAAFSLGLLRYDVGEIGRNTSLEGLAGQKVHIEVSVVEEPDMREKTTLLTVKVRETGNKLLLITNRYPQYAYGDLLDVSGTLEKPKIFETDQGKDFDYPSYLAKDNIYYLIFYPTVSLKAEGEGNVVKTYLLNLKSLFMKKAGTYIPEPEISLLGGLLVGAKHGLSAQWQDILRNAGIIHIVVLSGYNITIVAEAIMRLFGFLALRYRLLFGATAITLFAIMTGGSATVVRASLMALLVLLARATGRTYDITRALILAATLMVLHNPKILIFDPSFQLSFLATLGLVYLSPLIEKYFHLLPTRFQIRELLVSTISTQIFVTPLLLYMMGTLSIVSLPVNLLVLPLVPLTMFSGFVTGAISLIMPFLGFPFAYITYAFLHYVFEVAHFFGTLPFATISIQNFNGLSLVLAYFFITSIVSLAWYKTSKKQIPKSM